MTTNPTDLAYAAGLFDGEGSIMIMPGLNTDRHRTHPRLYVALTQVDEICLVWLKEKFGGKIRIRAKATERHRAPLEWYLCGVNATEFLRLIRPYLQLKAARADVAFEFRKTVQKKGGVRVPVAPETVALREEIRQKMRALNRVGPRWHTA